MSEGSFFRLYAVFDMDILVIMLLINDRLLGVQILHISEVDVRETKLMGDSPIIIVGVGIFCLS